MISVLFSEMFHKSHVETFALSAFLQLLRSVDTSAAALYCLADSNGVQVHLSPFMCIQYLVLCISVPNNTYHYRIIQNIN